MGYVTEELQLCFPDDRHSDKVLPVMDTVVLNPNDLIDQIISKGSLPSRKVFYSIMSHNHLSNPDQLDYRVEMSELYSESTVKSKAYKIGEDLRKVIKKEFQETSFSVSDYYVSTYLKRVPGEDPTISPIEYCDYKERGWNLQLTGSFKLYLIYYQKANDKKLHFTKGDKEILLKKLHYEPSDKLYWEIRKQQWTRGKIKFKIKELKAILGREKESNRNLIHSTLPRIQKEFADTWTEFTFKVGYSKKQGTPAETIELLFDKDELLLNKIKLNFNTEIELELYAEGVPVAIIQQIKYKVKYEKPLISDKGNTYTWNYHYVTNTLNMVKRKRSNGKVDDFVKFFTKAIFTGMFADIIFEALENNPPGSYPIFGERKTLGVSVRSFGVPLKAVEPLLHNRKITIEEYLSEVQEESGATYQVYKCPFKKDEYLVDQKDLDKLEDIELAMSLENLKPSKSYNLINKNKKAPLPSGGKPKSIRDFLGT